MSERTRRRPLRTTVELHVADLERSLRFYRTLDFEVIRRQGDWVDLERAGADLVLQADGYVRSHEHYFTPHLDARPRGIGVEIVVEVEDVEAVAERAAAAGLRIVKGVTERPWGARDFRIADPDGYFLRITSPLRD